MYYLNLVTDNTERNKTTLFHTDRYTNRIRKWSLLLNTPDNNRLLQLIALTCCGQRFAEHIPYNFPADSFDGVLFPNNRPVPTVSYTMAMHSPLDSPFLSALVVDKLKIVSTAPGALFGDDQSSDSFSNKTRSFLNIRENDLSNRFSLAYGSPLYPHIGTDDFDFNNPLFKLDRYNTLFDKHSLVTDPVAFLNRLHYKAVRCGRYPAKQTLGNLCALILKHLEIDTGGWQQKGIDFQQLWPVLKGWQQRSILPSLDIARHLTDAFPESGTPLHMPGVIMLATPNSHCTDPRFSDWINLMDELFPNIQFIATLSKKYIERFPERVFGSHIALPAKADKLATKTKRKVFSLKPNTILLIHVDGRLPNLALMKLSTYYKSLGYEVKLSRLPELLKGAEAVFASSVFFTNSSQNKIAKLERFYGKSLTLGGSGVDLKLRLPPEIETCCADYDLYPELRDRAIGFITRGCPYRCTFCLVPNKEGNVRQVSDFDDLLRGKQKLILLDDNLLAYPNVEQILEEMARRNLSVNFTQTLDIRLLNLDLVTLLKKTNWSNTKFSRSVIHFSLNGHSGLERIRRNYQLFDFKNNDNVEFVCMYDYDTSLEADVDRFRFIRSLPGAYVFVQKYQPTIDAPPKPKVKFFSSNTDKLIEQLIDINYRQNMKSMEKYYRWLSQRYTQEYGRIHHGLVDTLFRYNNRAQKGLYVSKLMTQYGEKMNNA